MPRARSRRSSIAACVSVCSCVEHLVGLRCSRAPPAHRRAGASRRARRAAAARRRGCSARGVAAPRPGRRRAAGARPGAPRSGARCGARARLRREVAHQAPCDRGVDRVVRVRRAVSAPSSSPRWRTSTETSAPPGSAEELVRGEADRHRVERRRRPGGFRPEDRRPRRSQTRASAARVLSPSTAAMRGSTSSVAYASDSRSENSVSASYGVARPPYTMRSPIRRASLPERPDQRSDRRAPLMPTACVSSGRDVGQRAADREAGPRRRPTITSTTVSAKITVFLITRSRS